MWLVLGIEDNLVIEWKLEANMNWKKHIMIFSLCQIVGMTVGMVLGLCLIALVWKMGWMEKFL